MLVTPPLAACPMCGYLLRGLPSAHRCPECGLPYDDETVLYRPGRPWKLYFGLLGTAACIVTFGADISVALTGLVGPVLGVFLALTTGLAILSASFVQRYLANRRGRFAAVTSRGIAARNLGRSVFVPWEELSMLSTRDISPWLKRLGDDRDISLGGIFDNKQEMCAFEAAVSRRRTAHFRAEKGTFYFSAVDGAGHASASRGNLCIPTAQSASGKVECPLFPVRDTEPSRNRPARWLASRTSRIAVILMVAGVLWTFVSALLVEGEAGWLTMSGVLAFWLGVLLFLAGAWASDSQGG